jgi:hypothetical protein
MAAKKAETCDILVSFDTTGSMYPCLTQVRRGVEKMAREWFDRIPSLRMGILAHGDYCDRPAITALELTDNKDAIINFIKNAPNTSGGDEDECYEAVLHRARSFEWTAGKKKAVVMIGDCKPHKKGYTYGPHTALDWKNEAKLLVEAGINIYPIQALGRRHCTEFYQELAEISGTTKIDLPQFSDVIDILSGVAYHQESPEVFEKFTIEVLHRATPAVRRSIETLSGKKLPAAYTSTKKVKIEDLGSRFQVMDIDEDCEIREFVRAQGIEFEKGRGFYEFTKTVDIQSYKEVIAQDRATGAIISGSEARKVLGIPEGNAHVRPTKEVLAKYVGFVQSTSVNRKLLRGTKFLYEIKELAGL